MNQTDQIWTAWSTVIQQVHESDQLSLPSTHHSFVASGRCVEPDAPAAVERMRVGKWKTLRTQGVTHTTSRNRRKSKAVEKGPFSAMRKSKVNAWHGVQCEVV